MLGIYSGSVRKGHEIADLYSEITGLRSYGVREIMWKAKI